MQPRMNPFRLQTPVQPKPAALPSGPVQAAPRISGVRGQSGEERAKVLSSMSQDPAVMASRIHYLKTLGKEIYTELQGEEEIGSSRLNWLHNKLTQQDI
ncbi:MAG: hypothetical protein WCT54_00550 [Patescibacteria group bacterium]